jgi:hypothetical protein
MIVVNAQPFWFAPTNKTDITLVFTHPLVLFQVYSVATPEQVATLSPSTLSQSLWLSS